ncbi:hypothetical protein AVEN_152083-1, partial [Araneus ventricosus]
MHYPTWWPLRGDPLNGATVWCIIGWYASLAGLSEDQAEVLMGVKGDLIL